MKLGISLGAAAAALLAVTSPAAAQEPSRSIVSIYHAAPGHQEVLMQWLAQQDRVAAEAGLPSGQVYVHMDGDDWDYLVIQPMTTEAQDAALEAAGRKLGIEQGPRAGLEFRKHIMSHSDTIAAGPMTAAAYLKMIAAK